MNQSDIQKMRDMFRTTDLGDADGILDMIDSLQNFSESMISELNQAQTNPMQSMLTPMKPKMVSLKTLLSILSSYYFAFLGFLFLHITGWNHLDSAVYELINKGNLVVVFSHTSNMDFIIFLLYAMRYNTMLPKICILVKPQLKPFERILKKIGCYCVGSRTERSNSIMNLISTIEKDNRNIICLSPKGQRAKGGWRSGYLTLSKALEYPISAAGLDYTTKKLVMHPPINNKDIDILEGILKGRMGSIVPYIPKNSEVNLPSHNPDDISACDWCSTSSFISGYLLSLYCFFYSSWTSTMISSLVTFTSTLYHVSNESKMMRDYDVLMATIGSAYFAYNGVMNHGYIFLLYLMVPTILYIMGIGRDKTDKRSRLYEMFHPWFHITCAFLAYYGL